MAVSRQVDLLEPIDLAQHLGKVELYLGQVCQIAGISKMQLDYWTNKAQIPTKGKKQRIYDIEALETVLLIKQAKDKGLNLDAATSAHGLAAASRLGRRWARQPGELRVRVRKTRTCLSPFGDQCVEVPRRFVTPPTLPRLRDECGLLVVEIGDRSPVIGCVDA